MPGGDNISNIIDVAGITTDITAAIAQITRLEDDIADANTKHLVVTVDAKGIENINALNQAIADQKALQQDLTNIQNQNATAIVKYGAATVTAAGNISNASNEVKLLTKELKTLEEWQSKMPATSSQYKQLGGEIEGVKNKIAALTVTTQKMVIATKEAAAATNNFQINIGKAHLNMDTLLTQIGRSILRFTAYAIVIGAVVKGFEFLYTKTMENIKGTDLYVAKMEKIAQATDSLKSAFESLGEEMDKLFEQRRRDESFAEGFHTEELRRLEALTKRKGEATSAEQTQHNVAEARRKSELEGIEHQISVYSRLQEAVAALDKQGKAKTFLGINYGTEEATSNQIVEAIKKQFQDDGLPSDFFDKIKADIDKSLKDNPSMSSALRNATLGFGDKITGLTDRKADVKQQTPDEINAQHNTAYDKRIELEKSFAVVREQLRQANEEQDSESLDKIVADTDAKYKVIIANIQKERKKFVESYTGDKNDAEYKKALGLFGSEVSTNQSLREQEKHNKDYERESRRHSEALSTDSKIASDGAGLGAASLATSAPSYNKMVEVLDKQTEAKKTALRNDFEAMKGVYDSDQIIELQKQQDEKLKQVDRDAYKERLGYATAYFEQMAQKIANTTDIKLNENSRRHFNNMAAIISSKGSDGNKNVGLFNEDIQNQRADAHLALEGIGKQIPLAQDAYGKADAATKGPLSADAKAQADEAKAESKKNLEGLYTQEAEQNFKLVDLDKQVLDRKKQGWKEFYESLPDYAQQAMSAIKQIQDNQFAAEQQQLEIKQREIELQSEQQIRAIDATAGFEITKDNEKQKVASQTTAEENSLQQRQNQLALKKAVNDKKAAEATILASTAAAIMKIWEGYADQGEVGAVLAAAETAVVAGIGAAQYAAAASAPLPQFAEGTPIGGTTQRMFIAGEAGPEVITAPGKPAIVVDKATIFNEDLGTQVIPMSRMYEYAAENVGKSGRYDAGMQAVYNNEVIMREVAKIIGEKYEEGAGEIVKAVRNSGNRAIKNTIIIKGNELQRPRA